jgi:hypothetical protein
MSEKAAKARQSMDYEVPVLEEPVGGPIPVPLPTDKIPPRPTR